MFRMKLEKFLVLEGLAVLIGLAFFAWQYLRPRGENRFRDDIWKHKPRGKSSGEDTRLAFEDQVDKKILLEHRPDPTEAPDESSKGADTRPPFRVPNFRGKPHEILGIPPDADAETIAKAHKHWIKRYHPDRVSHLGGAYVEQARRRAEQLNTARQEMLRIAAQRK